MIMCVYACEFGRVGVCMCVSVSEKKFPDLKGMLQTVGVIKGLTEDSSESSVYVIHLQFKLPHVFFKLLQRK